MNLGFNKSVHRGKCGYQPLAEPVVVSRYATCKSDQPKYQRPRNGGHSARTSMTSQQPKLGKDPLYSGKQCGHSKQSCGQQTGGLKQHPVQQNDGSKPRSRQQNNDPKPQSNCCEKQPQCSNVSVPAPPFTFVKAPTTTF